MAQMSSRGAEGPKPSAAEGEKDGVAADDEDFGVGEVDEVQDAVDEGVAERDQRVDGTEGQAVKRCAPEVFHEGRDVEGNPVIFQRQVDEQWSSIRASFSVRR